MKSSVIVTVCLGRTRAHLNGNTPHPPPSPKKRKLLKEKPLSFLNLIFCYESRGGIPPTPLPPIPDKNPHPTPASQTLNPSKPVSNRFNGQLYKKERARRIFVACIVEVRAPGVLIFSKVFPKFFSETCLTKENSPVPCQP